MGGRGVYFGQISQPPTLFFQVHRSTYWSRSIPRKENLRKALFLLSSAASSAFCYIVVSRFLISVELLIVVDARIRCQP